MVTSVLCRTELCCTTSSTTSAQLVLLVQEGQSQFSTTLTPRVITSRKTILDYQPTTVFAVYFAAFIHAYCRYCTGTSITTVTFSRLVGWLGSSQLLVEIYIYSLKQAFKI